MLPSDSHGNGQPGRPSEIVLHVPAIIRDEVSEFCRIVGRAFKWHTEQEIGQVNTRVALCAAGIRIERVAASGAINAGAGQNNPSIVEAGLYAVTADRLVCAGGKIMGGLIIVRPISSVSQGVEARHVDLREFGCGRIHEIWVHPHHASKTPFSNS